MKRITSIAYSVSLKDAGSLAEQPGDGGAIADRISIDDGIDDGDCVCGCVNRDFVCVFFLYGVCMCLLRTW